MGVHSALHMCRREDKIVVISFLTPLCGVELRSPGVRLSIEPSYRLKVYFYAQLLPGMHEYLP